MTTLAHSHVIQSRHTCGGCPDEYEGQLFDGSWFYLRYRWGVAQLGLGEDLDEAVADTIRGHRVEEQIGDRYDGIFESDAQRDAVFARLLTKRVRLTQLLPPGPRPETGQRR